VSVERRADHDRAGNARETQRQVAEHHPHEFYPYGPGAQQTQLFTRGRATSPDHVGRQFQEFHVVGLRADARWTGRCTCRHIVSMRAGEPRRKEFIKPRASDRALPGGPGCYHARFWIGWRSTMLVTRFSLALKRRSLHGCPANARERHLDAAGPRCHMDKQFAVWRR
jgi:hypothetical protein